MAARRGKNQARRNGGSGSGRPAWVWVVAGLAIGAVVFLAGPKLLKKDGDGFVRFGPHANPDAQPAPIADSEAIAETPPAETPPDKGAPPQYDFYTVLPGNEVRMSDAELAASAREEQARREQEEARRARDALEGRAPAPPATAPAGIANATPTAAVATATPATSAPPAAGSTSTPVAGAASEGAHYILQAGAFGASGDAEEVKAKIALLGLNARVESAQAAGRTVYRVRMGPYGTASELAEAKQKLASGGLPAMAIKSQ